MQACVAGYGAAVRPGHPAAFATMLPMSHGLPDVSRPRVSLAGPDVFLRDSARVFASLQARCEALGLEGVPPSDGGLGSDPAARVLPGDALAQRIYEGNIALIRSADGVLANLSAFRGHEPDPGTVFEVGFAVALGKPVVGYGVAPGSYAERIRAVLPCEQDALGDWREAGSGTLVEGLGQRLNLMLTRSAGIEDTAGAALARLAGLLARPPGAQA